MKRNSFGKVMGLKKSFPKYIIDGIAGRLEYDLSEEGYIRKKLKVALFRKHLYSYESQGFSWLDAMKLYNCFLWSQFEHMDAKMFDLEEDRMDEYGRLINQFISEHYEYNLRESILRKEFEETDLLEKRPHKKRQSKSRSRVRLQDEFRAMSSSSLSNMDGELASPTEKI